jgi:predicted TIM-barrel fold metal-dependent hydrolase
MREVIDCHANVGWDVNNTRKNLAPSGQTYKELLRKMDEYGVSKAVILPFPSPGGQFNDKAFWYDLENHNLINASNNSGRLIPFPAVNPADKESVKSIKTLVTTFDIKGVKFSHQIPMGFSIDKLIKHPLMKIVQDNNLLMMIHSGTGKESGAEVVNTTIDYAIKVAEHYPGVRFIFCHLGRLHEDLLDALELENVYVDTSGTSLGNHWPQFIAKKPVKIFKNMNSSRIIEKLVELGFEDKLLFGSDEPYTKYEEELATIKDANIPDEIKDKILSGNIDGLIQ